METSLAAPRRFDRIIIGSGSGSALLDAEGDVAIIDHGPYGGTCLNRGCIPTKMFVYPCDAVLEARRLSDLGVPQVSVPDPTWVSVRNRVMGRIDAISADALAGHRDRPGLTVYSDLAEFVASKILRVGREYISADTIVIAAGARPMLPPAEGLEDIATRLHTTDSVMRLERLPKSMIIVGGGPVACEFAHIFDTFGTHVTIVNMDPSMLYGFDHAVTDVLDAHFSERMPVGLRQRLVAAHQTQNGVVLTARDDDDVEYEYEAEVVLMATGRIPNTDLLNVVAAGLEIREDGRLVVDEHLRTTVEGIWALGDVCHDAGLKHVANYQARIVHHNLAHPDDLRSAELEPLVSAVFTSPEAASCGRTERECLDEGLDIAVGIRQMADVAYGWAMGLADGDGLAKVIIERGSGRILGGHVVGPQAAILVQPLAMAMAHGLDAETAARGQYWPHPALSEVVENALLDAACS